MVRKGTRGVPGWKLVPSRPDFYRLVQELKETGAKAILVDDADRFSRSGEMEVIHDVQELKEKHGIRWIHCANQGCVDLINDQFATMKIAMWAMASHEHCTRLSRRIAHTRMEEAKNGRRSGGGAPYAMAMADENWVPITPANKTLPSGKPRIGRYLIPGDKTQIKWLRQIFRWFAVEMKSMNWIAKTLNERKVPTRRGAMDKWFVATVKELLQQESLCGNLYLQSEEIRAVPYRQRTAAGCADLELPRR